MALKISLRRFLCCVLIFAASLQYSHDVFAQKARSITFNIPATTVDRALNLLGQQANVSVLFPFSKVQNLNSQGVLGRHTVEQALTCVTMGTGLAAQITKQGAVVVTLGNSEPQVVPEFNVDPSLCGIKPVHVGASSKPANGFFLEEVVVTSRRFSELAKDIPMSVTSISGESLRNKSESNIYSIEKFSPNINFTTAGAVSGSTSAAVIYIRGVGQNDYVPVIDPSVGVYVDDVYYGRSIGAAFNLIDVSDIEVLRGPQGTLLGRNTIGGAVSVRTHDPSGDRAGKLRVLFGDQGRKEAYLNQNFVLADRVNANLSLARLKQDGTVTRVNLPDSPKLGNEDSYGARTKLEWNASERLRFVVSADYSREREQSAPEVNIQFNESADLPALWNGFSNTSAQSAPESTAVGCVVGQIDAGKNCYNNRFLLGSFATAETSLSRNNVDFWGLSGLLEYDSEDQKWQSQILVSHRELDAFLARQVDGSPLDIFENRESYLSKQASFDLRIRGNIDWANLVSGLYYFSEKSNNQLDFAGALNGSQFPVHIGGLTDNHNFAAYGALDARLNERLRYSLGLRYTDETRRATPNAFRFVGCDINLAPQTINECAINEANHMVSRAIVPRVSQANSFSKVTWNTSLSYDFTQQTRTYISISSGFRSGGFEWRVVDESVQNLAILRAQSRGLSRPDAERFVSQNGALPSFAPETLISYEVGLKSESLDQGLRYSVSLFDAQYKNQIVATNPFGVATVQTNAAKSSLSGAELELFWVASDSWALAISLGFINARYKKLTNDALRAGLSLTDKFIFTPKWNASIGVSYSYELASGAIIPQLNARYKSSQEFEPVNTPFTRDDGYVAFDLGVRYKPNSKNWSWAAGIKNLTDERYVISGDANNVIGYQNVIYARSRNAYLSLSYEW